MHQTLPVLHIQYSGSQGERISILKVALTEKGVHAGSHYDFKSNPTSTPLERESSATAGNVLSFDDEHNGEDGGIHL